MISDDSTQFDVLIGKAPISADVITAAEIDKRDHSTFVQAKARLLSGNGLGERLISGPRVYG